MRVPDTLSLYIHPRRRYAREKITLVLLHQTDLSAAVTKCTASNEGEKGGGTQGVE